jgi:hypothetical protein
LRFLSANETRGPSQRETRAEKPAPHVYVSAEPSPGYQHDDIEAEARALVITQDAG